MNWVFKMIIGKVLQCCSLQYACKSITLEAQRKAPKAVRMTRQQHKIETNLLQNLSRHNGAPNEQGVRHWYILAIALHWALQSQPFKALSLINYCHWLGSCSLYGSVVVTTFIWYLQMYMIWGYQSAQLDSPPMALGQIPYTKCVDLYLFWSKGSQNDWGQGSDRSSSILKSSEHATWW